MINIKNIYLMYYEGFKNMRVGKTLWKIIFIKLFVILVFLKYFVHDKNFKTEYTTYEAKSNFVYENLKGK
ncbi:MAG: DUF4492 domain-containing protein [Campylobacterota bacterium]|nr:DUF4492 domain-containing protein [Campylobacterota bacterium]